MTMTCPTPPVLGSNYLFVNIITVIVLLFPLKVTYSYYSAKRVILYLFTLMVTELLRKVSKFQVQK